MTVSITEFLTARLNDDEVYARNAFRPHGDEGPKNGPEWREIWSGTVECGPGGEHIATFDSQLSRHIERHDPARVLREVEAKRKILDDIVSAMNGMDLQIHSEWGVGPMDPADYESVTLLRLLALPYSDHPDYREEWNPKTTIDQGGA